MIACLTVPYFVAAVEQRDDVALREKSLVIGGRPWEPGPVYAFSREVAQKGVEPGMSLRLAHVLSPQSHFMPAGQPRYIHASGEIVDVLTDFSHLLEPEDLWQPVTDRKRLPKRWPTADGRCLPARYTLDLEKMSLDEALAWAQEIGRAMRRHTHLAPAVGLAEHKFAAQVAASLTRPSHARLIAPDEEPAFLAARSISFIPLRKKTARRLRLLGINTLGQLAALPLPALQAQFGSELVPFYRLARGEAVDPLRPRAPEPVEQITRQFDMPLANRLTLEAVLGQMAAELAQRLQTAGREVGTVGLAWESEEDGRHHELTLRSPIAGAARLTAVLHELIHQSEFNHGITGLTVTLTGLTFAVARQLTLFEPVATAGQAGRTLRNVAAKHGPGCFYQAELVDDSRRHPLPERRFQLQAFAPA